MTPNLTIARANRERMFVQRGPVYTDAQGVQRQGPSLIERIMQEAGVAYSPSVPPYSTFLHQGVKLVDGKQQYTLTFDHNDTQANANYPTHTLLRKQDVFLITGFAMHLSQRDATAGREGREVLRTYPNATLFGAKAADLEVAYNGTLQFQQEQTVVFEKVPLRQCRAVPGAQQGAIISMANDGGTPPVVVEGTQPMDGYNLDMVRVDFARPYILWGNKSNKFLIDIPQNSNIEETAPLTNNIELTLFGFLLPGVVNQR